MENFSDFHLPKQLADSLQHMAFTTPTPIQAQAIPPALNGRDILGSAQTGTGKTAAFMIPLLSQLMSDERACGLVMTPTRELATQVMDMTRKLMGPKSGIRTALLIGGEPMFKQFRQLDARPRLIIGTPGRIDDHCRRNKMLLEDVNFLVLDEADRMLDMGFSVQIDSILKYMPAERQTLMFSATFSDPIVRFAKRYLKDPVRVAIQAQKMSADKIRHDVMKMDGDQKFSRLKDELAERKGSIIIFVKTRRSADQMAKRLSQVAEDDFKAEAIHGDLRQSQRDRTIRGFRMERFRILVATDVAARGLDIPHIEHVINYDLPQNPEDYIHRIGRTARAGAEGNAICFVTPQDGRNWSAIQRLVFPDQVPANERGRKPGQTAGRKHRGGRPEGRFGERSERPGNKFGKKPGGQSGGYRGKSGERNENRNENRFENRFEDRNSERPAYKDGNRAERPRPNRSEQEGNRSDKPRFERNRSEGNRFEGNRSERSDRPRSEGYNGKKKPGGKPAFKGKSEGGNRFDKKRSFQKKRSGPPMKKAG